MYMACKRDDTRFIFGIDDSGVLELYWYNCYNVFKVGSVPKTRISTELFTRHCSLYKVAPLYYVTNVDTGKFEADRSVLRLGLLFLVWMIFNEGAYLTFKSIFHKAINLVRL